MMEFKLLETCLYTNQIYLYSYHWQRLFNSAKYFNFNTKYLNDFNKKFLPNSCIRILLNKDGLVEFDNKLLEHIPKLYLNNGIIQLVISSCSIDLSYKQFFLHKTTIREQYDIHVDLAAKQYYCFSDVLLTNKNYITEACKGNIAILKNNQWYTPPVSDVLLGGTLRQYLLYYANIKIKHITIDELLSADKIIWFNSLRGVFAAIIKP